jgi:membrane associated rhomboid family serine protease
MRITTALIGINLAAFMLQVLIAPFTTFFWLVPSEALSGAWWQFITYMFMHGGVMHIMINMFVLFIFGGVIENALGERRYIMLYLISGVGSAFLYIFLMGISDIPMLGASGAVFGVMAAFGFMFPKEKIIIFPLPFPIPAFAAILAIAALELFLGVTGIEPGIANFGHLGGLLTGLALTYYWKGKRPKKSDVRAVRDYQFFWE